MKLKDLYCFDTSAFITLGKTNERVMKLPSALWDRLEKMMQEGEIISHIVVFDELKTDSKNPDFIAKWIKDKKEYFLSKTPDQIKSVGEIIGNFPNLIDPESETEQADPWVIALAIERSKELTLFGENNCKVVSQENLNSSKKIPAVCKFFKVAHNSLREFFDDIGLVTSFTFSS